MMPTVNKLGADLNTIVIFGAGRIGRSFIGQLFGCNGYHVVFVDVDPVIISLLNSQKSYRVVIKADQEHELIVPDVEAVSACDIVRVAEVVSTARILAVSVGKNALKNVIPLIAKGLMLRYKSDPQHFLDIILAENMRSAGDYVKDQLLEMLPNWYPLTKQVGLIETSIGKMVPIMSSSDLEKDPLGVFAEPYNTLILDAKGFKSTIPEIPGIAPKQNIKAWVDRKAFIHNMGHATVAYYGYFLHPGCKYLFEVLDDHNVYDFARMVMRQSAEILQIIYPDDFTFDELVDHIDDLLLRFQNKALKDTVFRVGQDLTRKLGPDDRFMGIVRLGQDCNKPIDLILKAMSYGLFFKAKNEQDVNSGDDIEFINQLNGDFFNTMIKVSGLDYEKDRSILENLKYYYNSAKVVNI